MVDRPRYTEQQLDQYFDRICLAQKHRRKNISTHTEAEQLDTLSHILKHHLVKVPWENLSQHYSWHRTVDIQPQHLFRKIVTSTLSAGTPGYHHGTHRGGYCMENNMFLHTVLLSLGFSVYLAGARIARGKDVFGGITHCTNIVTIGETRYNVDVGYGAYGAFKPFPMIPGHVMDWVPPASARLVYERIPQMTSTDQKVWIYQFRFHEKADWFNGYCYMDAEFLPQDIAVANFGPWRNPQSFFTHKVVMCRLTTSAEGSDQDNEETTPGSPVEDAIEGVDIDGTLTVEHDVLKWRRNGVKVLEIRFKNDAQRVMALKKYFGIVFDDGDVDAITGTAAEVVGALSIF